MSWCIEYRFWQYQPVSRNYRYIEIERRKLRLCLGIPQRKGRPHLQSQFLRARLHRRRCQLFAATRRAGRLRKDRHDLMPRRHECVECRHRKFRRSHEGKAHKLSPKPFVSRLRST